MHKRIRNGVGMIAACAGLAISGQAQAGEVTFTISLTNGTQQGSAAFTFNDDGATTTLNVGLTNTMTGNASLNWLTAAFFDIAGSPTMTYIGLGAYSSMITTPGNVKTPYNTVTADHFWGLRQGIPDGTMPVGAQHYGLSAAGLGVFSESNVLNLQAGGPLPQLDGSDGSILADIAGLAVVSGHQDRPMVLGHLDLFFDLGNYDIAGAGVGNLVLLFGTDFSEIWIPENPIIPLPSGVAMSAVGLGLIAVRRRRI